MSSSKPKALIIEDDALVARSIVRLIRQVGFEVQVSLSGNDALELIRLGARFNLVVSDVRMPGLDGPSFRLAAQALWPGIDRVLVFVSGAAHPGYAPLPCFEKPLRTEFLDHVKGLYQAAESAPGP